MTYPPPVSKKERRVLEIIGRGHPNRTMNVKSRASTGTVNSLEWAEIQIAAELGATEFGDCIAHLTAGGLIDSARELPSMFSRLRGNQEKYFFWITPQGRRFLVETGVESNGRAQMRSALATIDVELTNDDDVACAASAAAGLVRKLISTSGADPYDDDTIFTAGIFAFAAANHFSDQIEASSKDALNSFLLALLILADGSAPEVNRVFEPIRNAREQMGEKVKLAIAQGIYQWARSPSSDRLSLLSELFELCLTHTKEVG